MRKLLVAAVAAAVAVAGFAVFAFAGTGQQDTSWEFSFKPNKVNKPASSTSIIVPAKRDTKGTADESDDHYNAPAKSVIKFPEGSTIDTAAKARCKETPSDVQSGRAKCPGNTKIGSGIADNVLGQPDQGAGTKVVAPIEAFNQKKGILFLVKPCSPGTGPGEANPTCSPIPGGTVALVGTWSKVDSQPTLTVPTPPALLQGGVIITRFELTTNKTVKEKTVFVNGQRRTVKVSYSTTPSKCKGTWKSQAVETYSDGSKQTINDTQNCVKP